MIWVFGYGSLIWRPDLPFVERRAARITGWARRFWQASWDHRGTPESPGRVVTLIESPGAHLWGAAYAIADADWPEVLPRLEHREQAGYRQLTLTAALAAGDRASDIVAEVPAVIFVGGADRPEFIGPEPLAATADIVRRSRGPSGDNVEYVLALDRALIDLGIRDPDVQDLAALLSPRGAGMDPARVENLRHLLLALHKAIIDAERVAVERIEGRLTGNQMLDRLMTDERFAWLRPLTELIVRLDEIMDADTDDGIDASFALAVRLLTPDGDVEPFHTEYARHLHQTPEVTMAHAAAIRALTLRDGAT